MSKTKQKSWHYYYDLLAAKHQYGIRTTPLKHLKELGIEVLKYDPTYHNGYMFFTASINDADKMPPYIHYEKEQYISSLSDFFQWGRDGLMRMEDYEGCDYNKH